MCAIGHLGREVGTDKPVLREWELQRKTAATIMFCISLVTTDSNVDSKNMSSKLSSFFRLPAGRHLNWDNVGRLHEFPAIVMIATH